MELTYKWFKTWCGKRDSNPQPTAWKAATLPIELFPHIFERSQAVHQENGPASPVPKGACLPYEAPVERSMVAREGFEPSKT